MARFLVWCAVVNWRRFCFSCVFFFLHVLSRTQSDHCWVGQCRKDHHTLPVVSTTILNNILCRILLGSTVYYTLPYTAILYRILLYSTVYYYTLLYCYTLLSTIILYYILLPYTAKLYSLSTIILYHILLC